MELRPGKNKIKFNSAGVKLAGNLHCPDDIDSAAGRTAIVVSGPLATVKEQAAGRFAEKLGQAGFIALAFDFRTQGESIAEPTNYDNPANKGEDIQNAVSFLGTLDGVGKIGSLGICAGASYSMHGIVSDRRVKAFASVVGHFSLREFTGYNELITEDLRAQLLQLSNNARQQYFETGESEQSNIIYPDAKSQDDLPFPGGDAEDIFDYYYKRGSNEWPGFNAQLATMSYEALIKSNALDLAKELAVPYLGIVGSEAFSTPYTERFFSDVPHENKATYVIEGARHVQAYDIDEYIDQSIQRLTDFYSTAM